MNQRKRNERTATTGQPPKNANTTMRSTQSQAKPIKNAVGGPKATGYSRVKNAVSC